MSHDYRSGTSQPEFGIGRAVELVYGAPPPSTYGAATPKATSLRQKQPGVASTRLVVAVLAAATTVVALCTSIASRLA